MEKNISVINSVKYCPCNDAPIKLDHWVKDTFKKRYKLTFISKIRIRITDEVLKKFLKSIFFPDQKN